MLKIIEDLVKKNLLYSIVLILILGFILFRIGFYFGRYYYNLIH